MSRNMSELDEAEVPSVRRVCQDFMVREDGELAHRLQEEEFGHHYIRNRSERKTVREDVKAAKQTYLEEVKNAQILPDEELSNMEQTEQWLARDLQEKLLSEEACSERRKSELESRDEEIARQLQEKEALKLERARQRRLEKQLREEQETRMLQQAVKGLQGDDDNHFNHKETEDIQRGAAPLSRSRNGLVDTVDISTQESAPRGKKHSQTGRDPQKRYSLGEGAVVRLPANEGGRLESDRIIMADGTAIDLFDDSSDSKTREHAQKKSRERQDEEFARRLQEEEEQLVEQDRQAADDRKLALEFQDRELAKELQRREYIRLQKLKRERQLRRAQTVPSESSSGSTGELQAQQRLPSYEEAVHRNQIPDLLQDEPSFRTEQSHYRDDFAHRKYSSPERIAPSSKAGPFEQQRGALEASSSRSHSSVPTSLDREQSCDEECVWSSHNSSPHSSLERSVEYSEQSQRSSSGSSHSSSQAQATFEHCQSPTSPDTREGVWERLYEEGEDIHHNSRRHRGMTRSYTVATSEPSKHSMTDITDNAAIPNRTDCNIAEFIDPTFSRRQQTDHEAGASSTSEPKPKSMPLIQPQRRQSSDKKKRDKGGEKDCKQQ